MYCTVNIQTSLEIQIDIKLVCVSQYILAIKWNR
jgi:hypothetical protein